MRFYSVLLLFLSQHQLILIISANITYDRNYFNYDNTSINIDYDQFNSSKTTLDSSTFVTERTFDNVTNSCNNSCCTTNTTDQTSM